MCPPALRKLRTCDTVFSNDARRTSPGATALPMASSHHFTSPSFSLLGAASVMLCCSPPPTSSSTPLRPSACYPSISLVVNTMYIRIICDHLKVLYIFDPTCIVLKSGWSCTAPMPRLVVGPPSLSLSPPDATPKPMASSHHFTPPRQVSARLAPIV